MTDLTGSNVRARSAPEGERTGMRGMDARTGRALSGVEHLRQSIADILATPLGGRVMRARYGSGLFQLTDAPADGSALVDLYAAVAEALARWEPRFRLHRVQSTGVTEDGRTDLLLEGEYLPEGRPTSIEVSL